MRLRMLVPIALALLLGCADHAPTGPRTDLVGETHFGAFAGANGRIVFASNRVPDGGILTMNSDGSDVRTLRSQGSATKWSPDGTRIAFIGHDGTDNEVYVMNADGTGVTQLTFDAVDEQHTSWSADGTKIGFSSNAALGYQIYTIDANGGGSPVPMTSGPGENFAPAWSPDGSRIVFTSTRDGNTEIYVMNADGTGQTRLTNDAESDYGPAWSPDGSKIAFSRGASFPDIYVMNAADGSNQTNLTNTPGSADVTPSWSPDGTRMVFIGTTGTNADVSDVYVMNADGSNTTNITNTSASESYPDWQALPTGPTVTEQVQLLIEHLEGLGLPKGTTRSLRVILNDVLAALDAGNTAGACSALKDFISKVEAQSGKKIPAADAADLIQRAEAIMAELGCTPDASCYPDLPAPQLVLQSTTVQNGTVKFEFDVSNYTSFPDELFEPAPDLAPCGLNTSSARTWVDIYDGNGNFLAGFCSFAEASDLNLLWFQTPVDQWPAEAYVRLTDRRCNVTYTSNRVNLAGIL